MNKIEPMQKRSWLERPIFPEVPLVTGEVIIFFILIILMAVSRLYDLGVRVMSYDESVHAYYSWLFSIGKGYQYSPTTHGPLQFHLIALIFQLFGDSDFTARLPHAIASIVTVILLWKWRRYLGRVGTLIVAGLILISPYMLYYGRYARNEVFVVLLGMLTLYAILRYLETGKNRYLILLTTSAALQFTVKETAFIYTAQVLMFLSFYFLLRITRLPWRKNKLLYFSIIGLVIGVILLCALIGLIFNTTSTSGGQSIFLPALFYLACGFFLISGTFFILGFGWRALCRERSFSMLVLLGTFVLPQLASIPVKALGWNPLDYQFTWSGRNFQALWSQGPVKTALVLFILICLSISIGLLWDWKRWLINAVIFWGIYTFFFTSVFTNWAGLATGVVGSLGYWLEQQGVQRGNQPWYYYLLIQIPIYEFLPALGFCLAAFFGFRRKSPAPAPQEQITGADNTTGIVPESVSAFNLLFWWGLTSLLAFSIAGEKMPWLTVHIVLPMILLTGWGLGQVIERFNWSRLTKKGGWTIALLLIFLISILSCFISTTGVHPPFQGKTLEQLSATGGFLFSAIVCLASASLLYFIFTSWPIKDVLRLFLLGSFCLLAIQTARTAIRAAYIHPNDATEYLVYAQASSDVKDVMSRIDTLSDRTVGGYDLSLAYDASSADNGLAWPFTWYLRHYVNKTYFAQPTSDLRGVPVIIVNQNNFDSVKTFLGNDYYIINCTRLVWPNQDYFNLTWNRIKGALTAPAMRTAIWEIWFDRDYTLYSTIVGSSSFSLSGWNPSDKMELLINKDVASQIWEYGILEKSPIQTDPYDKGKINLSADVTFGGSGSSPSQFNAPHGIASAPDGSIYIADTNNNRIQHFSSDGKFINTWGTFSDASTGNAPLGTFNQPMAVAVSPDGKYIYVADTWNHRIQKFTLDGTPIMMWGKPIYDPTNNDPFGMWGPRGIAVDTQGRVFVADTGNKRILVYDSDGNFITQIGNEGMEVGQFEEPVGLAVDEQGNLYVADTWNQRIQVFSLNQDGITYSPSLQWDIAGWYGQSLDNKPYLALDNQGNIFTSDPESFRVLEFTTSGAFVRTWGDYGITNDSFGLPSGISVDPGGNVWVSDTSNNRVMRFILPK